MVGPPSPLGGGLPCPPGLLGSVPGSIVPGSPLADQEDDGEDADDDTGTGDDDTGDGDHGPANARQRSAGVQDEPQKDRRAASMAIRMAKPFRGEAMGPEVARHRVSPPLYPLFVP